MTFQSPIWLPGGHLQTIIPSKVVRTAPVQYRRERWETPDSDFIDVDFIDGDPGKPFLVLFHGLEGSSQSHYARSIMSYIKSLGWSSAVPHFRSCSGEMNHAPRFYHSGDVQELDWILRRLHVIADENRASRFYAVGASLGGNALVRWLGESQHQAGFVDAASAVSAPLCLRSGGNAIAQGFNKLYTHVFLRTLKPKSLRKLEQYPGLFDANALRRARTLYEFDNVVTAPLHGFRDTDDYWTRCSAKDVIDDVTVPTLILNAQNDPFLPACNLPSKAPHHVTLEYPPHGGHLGFVSGPIPGQLSWLPRRLVAYLESGGT